MKDSYMRGTSMLVGNNTIPGVKLHKELEELLPTIFKAVTDYGCDYYDTVVQRLRYDEMSEVAAYGGFPVRFPHWKWGMEYEELQKGYKYGMHKIYEMVVNTNPCYIYCLDSNTLVDDVTVVAHALGHCDFFKNNGFFSHTSQNMINELANHGTRIRRYMARHGKEKVTNFINHVLRIDTLIDPAKAWERKKIKNPIIRDTKTYHYPKRLDVRDGHEYMEDYINPPKWKENQRKRIERREVAEEIGIFQDPTKNIMKFIRDQAPLKPWQADIVAMLYEESIYFAPQRQTKMLNEGWASKIDYEVMAKMGLAGLGQEHPSGGIIEYAAHKMGVLGGKYSMNPYKLGFTLLMDIEDRWNKGRFGTEYDECDDMEERRTWNKNLGLGKEKIFEVRKHYDDLTTLIEFFTPEFCEKYEFFDWKKNPRGEYVVESTGAEGYKKIKKKLMDRHLNGGLPELYLADPNHKGKGHMLIQHKWDNRPLYQPYLSAVMESLCFFWKNEVYLSTFTNDGKEVVFGLKEPDADKLFVQTREEYLKE